MIYLLDFIISFDYYKNRKELGKIKFFKHNYYGKNINWLDLQKYK